MSRKDVESSRTFDEMIRELHAGDHPTFEYLRLSASNVTRVNVVDVTTVDETGDELAFCHIPAFLPFSQLNKQINIREPYKEGLNGLAAVLLALKHLNTGDGSVVGDVIGLDKRCNIRFTTEFFDTEFEELKTIEQLFQVLGRQPGVQQLPCSFLGTYRTSTSIPMSIVTGIEGYPQISHFATGAQLDDKNRFKLFGRVIPSDDAKAFALIDYMRNEIKTKHLGVVHVNDVYGYEFMSSLQNVANVYAPDIIIQSIDIPYHNPTSQQIQIAISFLASTQFRFFFGIITKAHYNEVMLEAYQQGIAGPKFTWMFAEILSLDTIMGQQFEMHSPLAIATAGISILAPTSNKTVMPTYDRFVRSWHSMNNEADIELIQSKIPSYDKAENYIPSPVQELFIDPILTDAALLYDATIAIGLGACNAKRGNNYFNGEELFNSILDTAFLGSTGNLTFDPSTGSRYPTSVVFELTNVQLQLNELGNTAFLPKTVALFQNGKWNHISPYIYSDGTTTIPHGIPPQQVNYNYIGSPIRAIGLFLCFSILFISSAIGTWTYRNRSSKVVTASQPIFLYIICFGIFLMATTIIALSIDDEIASVEVCSYSCIARPWLFSLGFSAIFSALFSKTWRLNKIYKDPTLETVPFTHVDVIKPLSIILVSNILVLTLWTTLSPLTWVRVISSEDIFGRPISSIGYCDSQYDTPFVVAIIFINTFAMSLALYQAYIGRHIQTELGETTYIALTIGSYLLVIAMGIPIILIVNDMPTAVYFVQISLIFVACSALILFILLPKIRLHHNVQKGLVCISSVVDETVSQTLNRNSRIITLDSSTGSLKDISSSFREKVSTLIVTRSTKKFETEQN